MSSNNRFIYYLQYFLLKQEKVACVFNWQPFALTPVIIIIPALKNHNTPIR